MNMYHQKENHSSFVWFFRTCSLHHSRMSRYFGHVTVCQCVWVDMTQYPLANFSGWGCGVFICADSVFLEISSIIRFWTSRFEIWKAFCWFVQVVNLERRRSGHRLWVNFHREGSRPWTGVIFGACKCCNQGLGVPCKSWREFFKYCKNKSYPPEKVEVASTKILGVHRLSPIFPGPELCIRAVFFLHEIWCIIRCCFPRLATWNAFCCYFQVVVR